MDAELGIYKKPWLLFLLRAIRKRIYTGIAELESFICTDTEPIPFEERSLRTLDKAKPGLMWGKAFTCSWFNFRGSVPKTALSKHIVLLIDIDGEGLYVNDANQPVSAVSSRLTWVDRLQSTKGKTVIEITDCSSGNEKIDIWLEGGFNGKIVPPFGKACFKKACIAICHDEIKNLYYDFLTLSYALCACNDPVKKHEISTAIKSAYAMLKDYSAANVGKASKLLNELLGRTNTSESLTYTAIGHSHLDLAWLWPLRETRRKAARTFTNALNNIAKYPEYIYGASQPQQFQWVKEDHPSLYSRIKEAVKKGRIELQGGMWTEPDTNIPSGESLIRQVYYGKKFFMEEFGQDMKICWLPDVFGYSANLPQILKKTGLEYFMTIKLSWNEHNTFPHRTFNWQGIDNSCVLVHMPPEGNYNSAGSPLSLKRGKDSFPEKDILGDALLVYGTGDGGGGPGEVHIELLKRQQDLEGLPKVRFGKAIDFFEKVDLLKDELKAYKGELYLEKHQGTYTTQARNKRFNRKIEFLLHDVETLASLAFLKGREYPHSLLEQIWKEVLLYQFHDILPGSGIKRVYDESTKRYKKMMDTLENEKLKILDFLSEGKCTSVINTSPFDRDEYIKSGDKWFKANVKAYSAGEIIPSAEPCSISFGDDYIENGLIRVAFSEKGFITSLYDKINKVECCGKYLNRLTLYTDQWKFFNAWDIDINYPRKRMTLLRLIRSETFADGPNVIRRNYYRHNKTTLTQDVVLTSGKALVEFDTSCDFHETFKMLRADFAIGITSDTVKCDIQFGSFDRSTKNDTPIEKAQFEICAHKWVDLSSDEYGVSVINDCKYGHRVKDGIISLNLLRSPVYPDPTADRGEHRFRYAFYPHKGNFTEGDTIKEGYLFNMPLLVCGSQIPLQELIAVDQKNIVIETVKKAEGANGIIVRAYECFGQDTQARINPAFHYLEAFECDMLENKICESNMEQLQFSPFEVKTILFSL